MARAFISHADAHLVELDAEEPCETSAPKDDLIDVAEFQDPIYLGIVETGGWNVAGTSLTIQ